MSPSSLYPPIAWFELAKISRSTPASAEAWKTLPRASRLDRSTSSHGACSSVLGRQVDDRVDAAEMRDPFLVELGQVGRDHVGVARAPLDVEQDEVIGPGPGLAELPSDVAAGARDQDRPGRVLDRLVVFLILVGVDDLQAARIGRGVAEQPQLVSGGNEGGVSFFSSSSSSEASWGRIGNLLGVRAI
jgi:hypothetical protein